MTAPTDETSVGGIVAHLRIAGGPEWARELEEAQRRAEALGRVNPVVRITTNQAALQADLAALRARLEALGNENTTLRFDLTAAQRQIEELQRRTGRQGGIAGRDFGAQFSRGLRETLAAIPDIEVDADTSDVDRQLQEVRAQMEALSRQRIGVDISAEDAMRAMAALQGELQALRAQSTDIDVQFNTAAATARIARLQAQLNGLSVTPNVDQGQFATRLARAIREASAALPKIDVDADSTPAQRELAEIRARMVALGQQKIGVDISAADAAAKLRALQVELDHLSHKAKDDLQIRVDTAAAAAKLAALHVQMNGLNGASRVGTSGGIGSGPLIFGAIIAGASLAGPLVGAATAGVLGLTGALGGAALAYKGLADAEARETSTGQKLRAQFKGIGAELSQLQVVAADRAAPGVLGALGKIRAYMPSLQGPIAGLARHLGQALNIGAGGTVTALRVMQPLLEDGGKGAEFLAQKWADFAGSPKFAEFVAYARRELPEVAEDLGDITEGLVDTAVALEPIGTGILDITAKLMRGVDTALDFGGAVADAARKGASLFNDPISRRSGGDEDRRNAAVKQAAQAAGMVAEYERRAAVARQRAAEATKAQESTLQALATRYGTTVPTLQAVIEAEGKTADQLAMTTLAMQRQNDVSGLLKLALDELSGKQLTSAQTQNAFDQAVISGARALESQKEATKDLAAEHRHAATSVTGLSEAAVANRGNLLSQVTAAMAAAGASGDLARSSDAAKARLAVLRQQIIDNAVAHGANREEVTKFINTFLDLNKLKPARTTAEFNADAARARIAEFRSFLNTLPKSIRQGVLVHGIESAEYQLQLLARNRTARINVVTSGGVSYQQSVGGRQAFADGGTVQGPGGPREDKVLMWASPGEEVINAAAAGRHRALLKAINAGKFADGGTVGSGIYTLTPTLTESRAKAKAKAKKTKTAKPKVITDAITVTAGGGQAYGIASFIRGQIPSVAQATRLLSLAVDNAFTLKGMQARVAAIRANLTRMREEQQSLASGVSTKLAEGADPAQFGSIGNYTAYLQAKAAQNENYGTTLAKLRGSGAIPADLLARFAKDGPSPILDSLAGGSRSDIAALVKANERFDRSVHGGSRQAAAIYGPPIARDTANLSRALAQSARTETAIVNAVLQLARITNKPIEVKLDGKRIAHAQFAGGELQGVINDLRRLLVTGRSGD